ncbi:sporulation protein YunB [Scatolibacter rhodanostii]|uniref:sporulation protein YunB n=1 Tax=Scatolibacter rhodanostii TaxID=2014781 RepID=UPI000C07E1B6|nr:sporulation protein YunB [Scatolibacter rhodanostii]
MRYISKSKPFFMPRYRKPKSKNFIAKRLILLTISFLLVASVLSEWALQSVSDEMVYQATKNYIEQTINEITTEQIIETEYIDINNDDSGKIISATTNTSKINQLKSQITGLLDEKLNGRVNTTIPFGSATQMGILNGRGFSVPLRLNIEGSVNVSFQTDFVSAGINQTCYRLIMNVNYAAHSQSKKFATDVSDSTSFVISETIIVGEVPQFMTGKAA